jgi:hypothetical protein
MQLNESYGSGSPPVARQHWWEVNDGHAGGMLIYCAAQHMLVVCYKPGGDPRQPSRPPVCVPAIDLNAASQMAAPGAGPGASLSRQKHLKPNGASQHIHT